MITRKAFLKQIAYQCLHIFEYPTSSLFSLFDPSCSEQVQDDQNALYREAMQLGIDPATMDENRIKEIIRKHQNESVHGRRVNS